MRAPLAALLLLAGCALSPPPSDLTAEEEAALDRAAVLLEEQDGLSAPLTEEELRTYPDARGMPADVQAFIVRWQDCSHWLGEPDWDETRRQQIARAVAEACPDIDALGRRVRERHAGNAAVIERLRDYEPLGQ